MKILFVIDQYNNDNNVTTISAKRFAKVVSEKFSDRGFKIGFIMK